MKKKLLLMAALLVMGGAAFAGGGLGLSIGPKVGYKTSKLSYQKDDIKAGFANSFTVGLFARAEIGNFYFQPEALWFKTSDVFTLNTNHDVSTLIPNVNIPTGAGVDFTLKAMNIQVPLLLGYKLNLVDNILALRAQVGPTLNFTIPQQTLVNQAVGSSEPVEISNESFDTKTIAFGLQGGLGLDILKNITLDINYNFGISKVFGAEIINNTEWGQYINTNNISDLHSNMFMVTIGYKLL